MQSSILREVVTVAWAAGDMAWGGGGNGILSVICVSRGSTNAGGAPRADYAPTIPQQPVIVYHPMFAIITSALIPGVFGERMKIQRHTPSTGKRGTFRVVGIRASWLEGRMRE